MDIQTIRNCFRIWAQQLPHVPSDELIDSMNLTQLSDKLHTSYMSYVLTQDEGTPEYIRFEKAYLHLWSLIRENHQVQPEPDKLQSLDMRLQTLNNKMDTLNQKLGKEENPFGSYTSNRFTNKYPAYTTITPSYSPFSEYNFIRTSR